jgi:hypothetical protein
VVAAGLWRHAWLTASCGARAARLPGCFYYTFADGRPALIPSACAAHAAADPSALALAPGAAPLAAAAAPVPAPLLCEPDGKDLPSPIARLPTADWEALAKSSEEAYAAGAAAAGAAATAAGDCRTVRASPGHLTACGHACLYGAMEATRCARLPCTSALTGSLGDSQVTEWPSGTAQSDARRGGGRHRARAPRRPFSARARTRVGVCVRAAPPPDG